jgi:hypothetical protein
MGIVESVVEHEVEHAAGGAIAGAALGPAGPVLLFLKNHWKLVVSAVVLIALGVTIAVLKSENRHLTKQRDGLVSWQGVIVAAVAAEVPQERRKTVTSSTARDEIAWLGRERRTLAVALDDQSAKLRVAQAKAVAADNGVKEALERASGRDKAREAARHALIDPKRSTGLTEAEWEGL